MSKKGKNIQEERRRLTSEIFDLYDTEHNGYIEVEEALKMLTSIGRKLEPEDKNEFLTIADPRKEGHVSKQSFLDAVESMYTIPDEYIPEIIEAFQFFDKDNDGRISCKEFKNMLIKLSKEYQDKDVDELFKIVDLDLDGYISIDEFINLWKFQ